MTVSSSSFCCYKISLYNQKVTVIFQKSLQTSVYVNLQVNGVFERSILACLIFSDVFVTLLTFAMNAAKGYDMICFLEFFILILETFLYFKRMIKFNHKLNYGMLGTSVHPKERV